MSLHFSHSGSVKRIFIAKQSVNGCGVCVWTRCVYMRCVCDVCTCGMCVYVYMRAMCVMCVHAVCVYMRVVCVCVCVRFLCICVRYVCSVCVCVRCVWWSLLYEERREDTRVWREQNFWFKIIKTFLSLLLIVKYYLWKIILVWISWWNIETWY